MILKNAQRIAICGFALSCISTPTSLSAVSPDAISEKPASIPSSAKWTVRESTPQVRTLLFGFNNAAMILLGGSDFTIFDSGFKTGGAWYGGTAYLNTFQGFYTYGGWIAGWSFRMIDNVLRISPELLVGIAGSFNTGSPGISMVFEPSAQVSLRLAEGISLGLDLGAHFLPMLSHPVSFMVGLSLNFRSQWVEWPIDEGKTTF